MAKQELAYLHFRPSPRPTLHRAVIRKKNSNRCGVKPVLSYYTILIFTAHKKQIYKQCIKTLMKSVDTNIKCNLFCKK